MNVFSIGLSGQLAEWCDATAMLVAQRRFDEVQLLRANTLEEVARETIRARSTHGIIAARQPSARLCSVIAEAGGRFFLALEDPRIALAHLVLEREMSLVEGVRAIGCGCAAVAELAGLPGALVLRADHGPEAAAAIGRYFDLHLTPAELSEVVTHHVPLRSAENRVTYAEWWRSLDERSVAIANGAFGAYLSYFDDGQPGFDDGQPGMMTWEHDLFYVAEGPQVGTRSLALGPADITGRPRALISGPSIALPTGNWHAVIALSLSPEATETNYLVEIAADQTLASARIEPPIHTAVEVELAFTVDHTLDRPIDIRLSTERAAFDGRITLTQATLSRRVAEDEPAMPRLSI